VVVAVIALTACTPLVALPVNQDALQDVALVELQLSVEVPPLAMPVGLAESVTVGAGVEERVTVALALPVPPVPAQVTV